VDQGHVSELWEIDKKIDISVESVGCLSMRNLSNCVHTGANG